MQVGSLEKLSVAVNAMSRSVGALAKIDIPVVFGRKDAQGTARQALDIAMYDARSAAAILTESFPSPSRARRTATHDITRAVETLATTRSGTLTNRSLHNAREQLSTATVSTRGALKTAKWQQKEAEKSIARATRLELHARVEKLPLAQQLVTVHEMLGDSKLALTQEAKEPHALLLRILSKNEFPSELSKLHSDTTLLVEHNLMRLTNSTLGDPSRVAEFRAIRGYNHFQDHGDVGKIRANLEIMIAAMGGKTERPAAPVAGSGLAW